MLEFMRKMTEWVLQKEEEAAKKCAVSLDDLQKQIDIVKQKRDKLQQECENNIAELDHILERLEKIKSLEMDRCSTQK